MWCQKPEARKARNEQLGKASHICGGIMSAIGAIVNVNEFPKSNCC